MPLLLVEGPERRRRLLQREPIPERERQGVFAHRLLRLLQRIGGGGDHRDAFFREPGLRPLESSQLLLAIGSPVRAVDQEDSPAVAEALRNADPAVGNRVHSKGWQPLAAIKNPGSPSGHGQLPARDVSLGIRYRGWRDRARRPTSSTR